MMGKVIPLKENLNTTIKEILELLLEKECFDAVLVPVRVPSGESFAYLLIKDRRILQSCTPLPPIMPVQGARALRDLTRRGNSNLKVLCVMRPCEIRASIELAKLRQIRLENVSFLSFDCPGALRTKDYINSPEESDNQYQEIIATWESENFRSACNTCLHFSYEGLPADLHIHLTNMKEERMGITPLSDKGKESLSRIGIECNGDLSGWQTEVNEISRKRIANRDKAFSELRDKISGAEGFHDFFSDCINCHNCMRVCPICYCRQCFFDVSGEAKSEAEDYLAKIGAKGGIRFPGDMMLFHLGRMSHMALSCVSCGSCEDGCPMEVPVSRAFAFVADEVQKMFDYVPGRNEEEPIPVQTYQEDELHQYEDAKGTG